VPVVDVQLLVPIGAAASPAGKAGTAALAAAMMTAGTTSRTSLQIADQAAFLGASLETTSTWDATVVSLTTPKAQFDSAFALFADVALHPSFPAAEFDRVTRGWLTTLVQQRDRAPAMAERAYAAIVYGVNHPYGQPLNGTESSVGGLTAADVKAFYTAYFSPAGATIIVVGDVAPADIERRVTALFEAWSLGTVVPDEVADLARSPIPTTIYLIDTPGAPRSEVRLGGVGVARSRPDYFPVQVLNHILGGAPTSQLVQQLRTTTRSASVASTFDMRRAAGPFTVRATVVASQTDAAVATILRTLRTVRDSTLDTDVARAKSYLQHEFQSTFASTADLVQQLAVVALYGRPPDYYDYFDNYRSRVAAVRPGDVARVARRYLDTEHMVIVVVGDRTVIEPRLRALHTGPVVVWDAVHNAVHDAVK
jgi:predicted Zn-dependent peptidase